MDRRDFLKAIALTGVAMIIKPGGTMDLLAQSVTDPATGGKTKAIAEMGGMKKFVKAGAKVAVKPNIGWDKTPELAGNTNPKLIAEIVKQCLAAGAKEVAVFDHTCDDWIKCYKNSGIEDAAKTAGAKVVPATRSPITATFRCRTAKSSKTPRCTGRSSTATSGSTYRCSNTTGEPT